MKRLLIYGLWELCPRLKVLFMPWTWYYWFYEYYDKKMEEKGFAGYIEEPKDVVKQERIINI